MSTEKLNSWGEYIPKDINIILEKTESQIFKINNKSRLKGYSKIKFISMP
jgi:hypothetical protein